MSDDWEITTGDGGVTLYLPKDFDADLDAHTGDGAIRNELDVSTANGGESNAAPCEAASAKAARNFEFAPATAGFASEPPDSYLIGFTA